MAAKKKKTQKKKPGPPKVEQTEEGVRITHPDRTLRSEGRERAVSRPRPLPVRCPYCKEDGREGLAERITGASPGITYYRCLECCDPERGEPTTFKVIS